MGIMLAAFSHSFIQQTLRTGHCSRYQEGHGEQDKVPVIIELRQ